MGYSDNGVDEHIARFLPEFGYACDVGANNGIFASNTLKYEEQGWIVLCVEPNPELEGLGRAKRKLWRSVAAGREDREATFFAQGVSPWASASTIDLGSGKPHQVQMYRLDRLLEEAEFPRLDYLTVDVEGYEPEVFAGFTLARWNPRVIVYEAWTDEAEKKIDLPGYIREKKCMYDCVYVRADVWDECEASRKA